MSGDAESEVRLSTPVLLSSVIAHATLLQFCLSFSCNFAYFKILRRMYISKILEFSQFFNLVVFLNFQSLNILKLFQIRKF
jgi:hypothetical protein